MIRSERFAVVTTRHGARAMLDCASGEVMHPVVGPIIEAERLYVTPSRLADRLTLPTRDPLVLFDVGLGAGSNAIAAWRLSESLPRSTRKLEIVSFDHDLGALALALAPEHAAHFALDGPAGEAARALLASGHCEGARTSWRLVQGELLKALLVEPPNSVDMVFWDPFSPKVNPSLWTVVAFRFLRRLCRSGCTVHTYSGATATRSALLLGGFAVGIGEPIGEKEQTTCAAVRVEDLARPLDLRWLARLGRSSAPLPSDAPPDALRQIAALPQFGG